MSLYEYRLVPANPYDLATGKAVIEPTAVASALAHEMNMRAMLGWEFVGSEWVAAPAPRWRRGKADAGRRFLVFRRANATRARPTAAQEAAVAGILAPPAAAAVRAASRTDLIEAVRAGKRRIHVRQGPDDRVAAE
jgi:hypothetical protein